MRQFTPHARTKTALAVLYFPDEQPPQAVRHLMRWVTSCAPLVKALHELGYHTHQRHFTAAQVKKIVAHIGEPPDFQP